MTSLKAILPALMLAACATVIDGRVEPYPTVLDTDFPDPFVLAERDVLHAYATNTRRRGQALNVQVSRSIDGVAWTAPAEAMPDVPPWALAERPDIWAPEVIAAGGRYVLYFSARHATLRRPDGLTLCIGAATADRPEGPFTPQAQPLLCEGPHGAIDASPFHDDDDLWLYTKTDGNCCGTAIQIRAHRLSDDGLTVRGAATVIAGLTNDAPWEGAVIEAPQMVRHGDRYWMFYTANDFGAADYAIGYAACEGPAGPCRDADENPILAARPELVGPGHQSVFRWRGETWVAFHSWRSGRADRARYRVLHLARLDWSGDRPRIVPINQTGPDRASIRTAP